MGACVRGARRRGHVTERRLKPEVPARGEGGFSVVEVTRLDGKPYYINPHQIEYIENNPDTTLVMLSGKRLVVKEDFPTIFKRIVEYRKLIGAFKNEE